LELLAILKSETVCLNADDSVPAHAANEDELKSHLAQIANQIEALEDKILGVKMSHKVRSC